jgi:hypothetical protein
MKAIRTMLAMLLALFAVAAPAAATARPLEITISETAEGVRVAYDLPAPVSTLPLGGGKAPPSPAMLRSGEGAPRYESGEIRGAAPFRHATLVLTPDAADADARYPLLTAVRGRGFVLFAPYIIPYPGDFRARVSVGNGRYRALTREEAEGGYVVVGASAAATGPFRSITGTNVPAALERVLHARAAALLEFYAKRLRKRLDDKPLVIIAADEESPAGFRGDVTRNGVVLLRFRGTTSDGGAAVGQSTTFLAHELFHLWNGAKGNVPERQAWLYEGAAEYFSWIAGAALWPGEVSLDRNVDRALTICMGTLRADALSRLADLEARQARYACGAVVQWIVDVGARSGSGGRRDGLDLWATMLAGRGGARGYTPAEFDSAAAGLAPGTFSQVQAIVEGRGLARWNALAAALVRAGADVEAQPPTPFALRFEAVRALVLSACGELWGVGEEGVSLYVNAPPACEPFGDRATIVSAAGVDPMAEPSRFREAVEQACAAGRELALVLGAGLARREGSIRCTVKVESSLPDLRVRRALPLPLPG